MTFFLAFLWIAAASVALLLKRPEPRPAAP